MELKLRLEGLKIQLDYVNNALNNKLESWELKEYVTIKEDLKEEIKHIEEHIHFYNL